MNTGDNVITGNQGNRQSYFEYLIHYAYINSIKSSVSGLKDQLEAFKFIKKIIRNFGGDPNKVTIFGESAGGSSVHYHMLSPQSKGKTIFHLTVN